MRLLKGCFIFFHKWIYNKEETERKCSKCGRTEFLDLESDVSPWSNPLWLKKN